MNEIHYDSIKELYDKDVAARRERSIQEFLANRASRELRKKARKAKKRRVKK